MKSFIIVIFYPLLGQIPCLIKREEQVGIQHILAVGSVETFHYGILLGLPLLDFCPFYFVLIKPLLEKMRGELRSIIRADSFWLPVLLDDALKIRNHRPCRHRVANVDAQALPVVLIHDVQRTELRAVYQRATHKVCSKFFIPFQRNLNWIGRIIQTFSFQSFIKRESIFVVHPADLRGNKLRVFFLYLHNHFLSSHPAGPQYRGDGLLNLLIFLRHPSLIIY